MNLKKLFAKSDVEAQYAAGEIATVISSFLRSINQENRIVFIRRYWYSDSIKDISAQRRISESKIKCMLFCTRKMLRRHLEKEGVTI